MVEIRLAKCLLVLTESELRGLLARDQDLWITALRRGKSVMRQRQAEKRGPKHISEILPGVLASIEQRTEGRER